MERSAISMISEIDTKAQWAFSNTCRALFIMINNSRIWIHFERHELVSQKQLFSFKMVILIISSVSKQIFRRNAKITFHGNPNLTTEYRNSELINEIITNTNQVKTVTGLRQFASTWWLLLNSMTPEKDFHPINVLLMEEIELKSRSMARKRKVWG